MFCRPVLFSLAAVSFRDQNTLVSRGPVGAPATIHFRFSVIPSLSRLAWFLSLVILSGLATVPSVTAIALVVVVIVFVVVRLYTATASGHQTNKHCMPTGHL
jgi:hypothetical protein